MLYIDFNTVSPSFIFLLAIVLLLTEIYTHQLQHRLIQNFYFNTSLMSNEKTRRTFIGDGLAFIGTLVLHMVLSVSNKMKDKDEKNEDENEADKKKETPNDEN